MKRNWRIVVLTCNILAVLLLCLFSGCADPAEPVGNGTGNKVYEEDLAKLTQPVFSDRGGFYGNKMAIKISVPQLFQNTAASLKITLDGSEPDKNSRNYSGEELILPDIGCVKTDFTNEAENVSVTVIRAACFDGDGAMLGQIATATYIKLPKIKGEIHTGRFDLPVISLVTDGRNLTDPAEGILANVSGKGSEWERPVNVAYFEANGRLGFTQDAGIRLSGGSTRGLAQKSFRVTARKSDYFNTDRYDGAGKFKYALFPERLKSDGTQLQAYDSVVLRNGGNDSVFTGEDSARASLLRDGLAARIAQKAAPEVDAMAYRPVVVFLNGEYYGIMNLREYENNKYVQNVYGIEDKDSVTVISTELNSDNGERYDGTWFSYQQEDGPAGELGNFTTLLQDIVVNGAYSYEQAAARIDMDNFMKYCAVNLFVCNTDWPHNNVRVWRYAGNSPGALADPSVTDGKWRFMLKDTDVGMGRYVCGMSPEFPVELYTKADSKNFRLMLCGYLDFGDLSGYPSVTENSYPDSLYIQGLFYFCMQDGQFASQFYEYCNRLATEIWTPEALETLVTDCAGVIDHEIQNHMSKDFGSWRWQATTSYQIWKNAVSDSSDSLISWARDRSGADGEFLKQVNELRALLS